MCLQIILAVFEWLGEQAELLNIGHLLVDQRFRADIDGEVRGVRVPIFFKETTLASDSNGQVNDKVTGDCKSIDSEDLSKAIDDLFWQELFFHRIQIGQVKVFYARTSSELSFHIHIHELIFEFFCLFVFKCLRLSAMNAFCSNYSCLNDCSSLFVSNFDFAISAELRTEIKKLVNYFCDWELCLDFIHVLTFLKWAQIYLLEVVNFGVMRVIIHLAVHVRAFGISLDRYDLA